MAPKRLWRRIEHYVNAARARDVMTGIKVIGIDETSVKRGHEYVTVVHDLEAKRLLFMTPGRKHDTVVDFKAGVAAHGGDPDQIEHVCYGEGTIKIAASTSRRAAGFWSFPQAEVK